MDVHFINSRDTAIPYIAIPHRGRQHKPNRVRGVRADFAPLSSVRITLLAAAEVGDFGHSVHIILTCTKFR